MRTYRGTRCGTALATTVVLALGLAGCDPSDDDSNGGDRGGDGAGGESATASAFADVIAFGTNDDPPALDGEALEANLDKVFGTVTDNPKEVDDEDTVDTLARRDARR